MARSYTPYHPGLLTDLYHPDSAYVAWRAGRTDLITFDLYARRAPFGGAYLLVAFVDTKTVPAGFFSYAAAATGIALAAHLVVRKLAPNADPLLLPIGLLLSGLGYAMVRRLMAKLGRPVFGDVVAIFALPEKLQAAGR